MILFLNYYWHRFLKWCRFQIRILKGTAIQVGDYYEDCGFVPRIAIKATAFDIRGNSLVPEHNNSWGDCDPEHCAPVKLTKEQAHWEALYGPWSFADNYNTADFKQSHGQQLWWTQLPYWLLSILMYAEINKGAPNSSILLSDLVAGLKEIHKEDIEFYNRLLAHAHWFINYPKMGLAILTHTYPFRKQCPNYRQFLETLAFNTPKGYIASEYARLQNEHRA